MMDRVKIIRGERIIYFGSVYKILNFTYGKIYDCQDSALKFTHIYVKDDSGNERLLPSSLFKKLSELRNQKVTQLGL